MKNRANERGAAMVEGAVILPLLAIFFGLLMLVHNTALMKLRLQGDTRNAAFANASHACIGSGSIADILGIWNTPVPAEGNPPDQEKSESLRTEWLESKANKTDVAIALKRTQKVEAHSHVYCNPYSYNFFELPIAFVAFEVAQAQGFWKMAKFVGWALKFVPAWSHGLITF